MQKQTLGTVGNLSVEQIIVDVIPVIIRQEWDVAEMANIRTELRVSYIESYIRNYILEMKMFLLGKKDVSFESVTYTKVPKTWFDHFKETHKMRLPHWFLKRFPIEYKDVPNTTMKTTYRVCPHVSVGANTAGQQKVHFRFMDGRSF